MNEHEVSSDINTEEILLKEFTEFLESLEASESKFRPLFSQFLSLLRDSHTKNESVSKYCSVLSKSLLVSAERAQSLIHMTQDDGKTTSEYEKELESIWKNLENIESSAIKSEEMIESLAKQKQEILASLHKETEKEQLIREEINQLENQLHSDSTTLVQLLEDKEHLKAESQKLEYALIHANEAARKTEENVEKEEKTLAKARLLRESTEAELTETEADTEYMQTEIGQFKSRKYQHERAAKSLRGDRVECSSLLDIYRSDLAAHTCNINSKRRRLANTISHKETILRNIEATERKLNELSRLIDRLKSETENTNALNEELQLEHAFLREHDTEINNERTATGRLLKETEKAHDLLIFAERESSNENKAKTRQIQATSYNADMARVSLENEKQATEREEHFNKFVIAELHRTKNDNFQEQLRATSIPREIRDFERKRDEILPQAKSLESKTKLMKLENYELWKTTDTTKREMVIMNNRVSSEKTLLNMVQEQLRSIDEENDKIRTEIDIVQMQNDDAQRVLMDRVVECFQLYCDRLEAEKRISRLEKTTKSYEKLLSDSEEQQNMYKARIHGLEHTLDEAKLDITSREYTANLNTLTDRIYKRELHDRCAKVDQLHAQVYTMTCELRIKADHYDKQTQILKNMRKVLEMESQKHAFLWRKLNSIPSCKCRIIKLEREIIKMQRFRVEMEASHTTPMNIHRWQILNYQNSPYSRQVRQMLYLRSTVDDLDHRHAALLEEKAELERQYKREISHVMNMGIVHDRNMIHIAKSTLEERNRSLDQLQLEITLKKDEVSEISEKVAKLQAELGSRERAERLKRKKTIMTVKSTNHKVSIRKRETSPFVTQNNTRSPRNHFKPTPPSSQNNSFVRRSNF